MFQLPRQPFQICQRLTSEFTSKDSGVHKYDCNIGQFCEGNQMNPWPRLQHSSGDMGTPLLNKLLPKEIELSNLDCLPYGTEKTKIMMGIVSAEKTEKINIVHSIYYPTEMYGWEYPVMLTSPVESEPASHGHWANDWGKHECDSGTWSSYSYQLAVTCLSCRNRYNKQSWIT